MRVALLCHSAPRGDAIGRQIAEKVAFFLDRGADVRVFLESDDRIPETLRPNCQGWSKSDICPQADQPDERTYKFLTSADLIFVEYSQWFEILNWLPLLAGGKARIIFDYHGVTPRHLWRPHNREAIEKGARQRGLVWCADAALTHSRFAQKELLGATYFPEARTRQLGYPLDASRYSPGKPLVDWRERLGLGPVRLLLFVGRLAPNKHVPVLVKALARLKDQTPAIHSLIVGDTGDTYAAEAQLCRDRAAALGVFDRLHLLGRLSEEELLDVYRSADLFVMPSVHEGFGIPVVEAMACGLPVLAARAAALPETVASAGLTFIPDDADDLARQVRRVLCEDLPSSILDPRPLRVALVTFRFGGDFVGGAESSLRTAAQALRDRGHQVEVFTTCTNSESNWSNELPEGPCECDGLTVHRFRIDSHDRASHLESVRKILQAEDGVPPELEDEYLQHSIRSTRLVEELHRRVADFDAIIVGPYLYGLTWDVAREMPEKTIVVPCFHDERYAHFRAWPTVYGGVGGIWYHSDEEMKFAEAELGLNHPGAACLGTWLDTETPGDAERGQKLARTDRPYLVYAGRYSEYKSLPTLLEFAHRYSDTNPNRFTFVFLGEGHIKIPSAPWARDLGFIEDSAKRDVLAGAAATIQMSRFESLSLVALESWAQGTPVLADRRCAVLAGHLERSGGGRAVDSYSSFAAALDDLWENAGVWQKMGWEGQQYVRENYGSQETYVKRLEDSIRDLTLPLAKRMRQRGMERAALESRSLWRERFAEMVEHSLDSPPRPRQDHVEVTARSDILSVASGQETMLIPVRLHNRGTHTVPAEGPGRHLIRSLVGDGDYATTPLPDLLMPGQTLPAAVAIHVPRQTGEYQVTFQLIRDVEVDAMHRTAEPEECSHVSGAMRLIVENRTMVAGESWSGSLVDMVRAALAEANRCQRLPDDYIDVTEGRFARLKRWIKRKLLGNFKHAYVDVLSRQQSRFNQQVLTALTELADYCATLEHAVKAKNEIRNPKSEVNSKAEQPMFETSKWPGF
jgi:glycosyltransferase involved in cell wall biosynthesis